MTIVIIVNTFKNPSKLDYHLQSISHILSTKEINAFSHLIRAAKNMGITIAFFSQAITIR